MTICIGAENEINSGTPASKHSGSESTRDLNSSIRCIIIIYREKTNLCSLAHRRVLKLHYLPTQTTDKNVRRQFSLAAQVVAALIYEMKNSPQAIKNVRNMKIH